MDLNCTEEQKSAINAPFDKPVAIIACPGSGKTFTIIHRVAHLLQKSFRPSELLVITFTRKAAQELRTRLKSMHINIAGLTVQTFHSFGLLILRKYKHLLGIREFRIITQKEQMEILESVAKATPNKEILLRLQVYKTQGQCEEELRPIFDAYNKTLRNLNACDFTDLIVLPLEILKRNPEVVAFYQRRYKYALVDEMQDVSKVQFDFMKILFGDRGRLTVVGDDDQTIYTWRGADASLLLQFTKVYQEATIIRLTNCFRCPPHIVKAMSKVIQNNKSRVKKTIESMVKTNVPSYLQFSENRKIKKITIYGANSLKDEAFLIATDMKKVIGRGTVAVLFRTRKAAQYLKVEMQKQNVLASIYDRARFLEAEDVNIVLNILQMCVGIPYNSNLVPLDSLSKIRNYINTESTKLADIESEESTKPKTAEFTNLKSIKSTKPIDTESANLTSTKSTKPIDTESANLIATKSGKLTDTKFTKLTSIESANLTNTKTTKLATTNITNLKSFSLSPQADLVSASDDKQKKTQSPIQTQNPIQSHTSTPSSLKFLNSDSDFDADDIDELLEESKNTPSTSTSPSVNNNKQQQFLSSSDEDDDDEVINIIDRLEEPTETDSDFDFVKKTLRKIPPTKAITIVIKSLSIESESINFLLKDAKEMETYEDESNEEERMTLTDFLYTVRTSTTEETNGPQNIHMSTIHQAKGLEWDYVYIIGASKGSWPSKSSTLEGNENKLEEERRLFYVAMSRAKKELTISFITDLGQSMFIDEIPSILIKEKIHRKTDTTGSNEDGVDDPLKRSNSGKIKFSPDQLKFKKVSAMADSQPMMELPKLSNQFVSASNLKLNLTSDSQNNIQFQKPQFEQKENSASSRNRLGMPRLILKKDADSNGKPKQLKLNI